MKRIPNRLRRGERGQALVEFALVAVVFFMFIFGIMDGARLFQSWMTVQHSSREAARYGITGLTTCEGASTRDNCIKWTAKNATTGLTRGGSNATDANVTVTWKSWDYPAWTAQASTTGGPCDQMEVTVAYTHRFVTPFWSAVAPSGVNITGRQRMTNEPWSTCS
jgi:Flp pilus assembly protein TadG